MMRREDFHLTLDLTAEKELLVTAQSSVGMAEARAERKLAELAPNRKIHQRLASAADMKDYGAQLYAALLPGEIRDLFVRSLDWYSDSGWMRIRLSALRPEVAAIPWELAFDRERNTFLALDPRTPIFRTWKRPLKAARQLPAQWLNVLVCQPNPQNQVPIDTESERESLQTALEIPRKHGQVQFKFLDQPVTLEKFRAALEEEDYEVIHFGGHGLVDPVRKAGALLFEDEDGKSNLVEAEVLGTLFAGKTPRLVTLLAENSASFREDILGDLVVEPIASTLIKAGVPAVVGLQGLIRDSQLGKFVRSFYASIADGQPLERALTEGRRAVYSSRPDNFDWMILVLYLADDLNETVIFAPARSEVTAQKGQSVYTSGGAVIKGDRQSINVSQKVQMVEGAAGVRISGFPREAENVRAPQEEAVRAGEGPGGEDASAVPKAPLTGAFDFSVPGLGVEAAAPVETAPQPLPRLGLETISPLIKELKQSFITMTGLSPRERIQRLALTEELRFSLMAARMDEERVLKLVEQISVSGPKPAQLLSDLSRRFETVQPKER